MVVGLILISAILTVMAGMCLVFAAAEIYYKKDMIWFIIFIGLACICGFLCYQMIDLAINLAY